MQIPIVIDARVLDDVMSGNISAQTSASGSFTSANGKVITVTNDLITAIVRGDNK